MKVDVVVSYYEPFHAAWWPAVSWGLTQNAAHINRVIVVNDGLWKRMPPVPRRLQMIPIGLPKADFGLCRSLNVGLQQATTDHVLIIEGDEILAPDSLAETLPHATPTTLLCCCKRYVDETPLPPDHDPTFIEEDHRHKLPHEPGCQWRFCSGGHLLTHRLTHKALNGFDERYTYGLHDFDYAARWMALHGDPSVRWSPDFGDVWHIGSGKGRAYPSADNQQLFLETRRALEASRTKGRP